MIQKRFNMCIYNPRIFPRITWSVIGLFGRVMNNNVELCSDWLFHSTAQCWALLWLAVSQYGSFQLISHTVGRKQGKYIYQYFLSQLYRQVIILYIKCGHQGALNNMLGTETAFKCTIARTLFILWSGSTYHKFDKIRCLSVVLRICKSSCCKWNLMYCNVTSYC